MPSTYIREPFDLLGSLRKSCHHPGSADVQTEDQTGSDLPKGTYVVLDLGILKNPLGHWGP